MSSGPSVAPEVSMSVAGTQEGAMKKRSTGTLRAQSMM